MLRTTSVFVILAMLSVQMLASHHHHHNHHHSEHDEASSENYLQHLHQQSRVKKQETMKSAKYYWYSKNSVWLGYCLVVPQVPPSACFKRFRQLDKDLKVHKLFLLKSLKAVFPPASSGKLTKDQKTKIQTFFKDLSAASQKIMKDVESSKGALTKATGKVSTTINWYVDNMNVKSTVKTKGSDRYKEFIAKYKALNSKQQQKLKRRIQYLKLIFRNKGMKHTFWSKAPLSAGKTNHLDQHLGTCAKQISKLPDLAEVRQRVYGPVGELGKAGVAIGEALSEILNNRDKYCK